MISILWDPCSGETESDEYMTVWMGCENPIPWTDEEVWVFTYVVNKWFDACLDVYVPGHSQVSGRIRRAHWGIVENLANIWGDIQA